MKKAFTLAEVLIVIVIIGIIAILMITALQGKTPDKDKLMFKKTYADISRAASEVANDMNFYNKKKKYTPILRALYDADYYKVLAQKYDPENKMVVNENNIFCFAMSVLMGDEQSGRQCNSCNENPNLNYNFTTTNGTRIYGLCGPFSSKYPKHTVYLYVNPTDDTITTADTAAYKDDRPDSDNPKGWKTKWYKLEINSNAKVYIDSKDPKAELERLILKDEDKV